MNENYFRIEIIPQKKQKITLNLLRIFFTNNSIKLTKIFLKGTILN